MKKVAIKNGLIAGGIVSVIMMASMAMHRSNPNFTESFGMIIGYGSMLLSFIFIFIGVKNFRDKQNDGIVTFWQALKIGLLISFIASTMYVVSWAIDYHFFIPDFMEKYTDGIINGMRQHGASETAIAEKMKEMAGYKEMYKNPILFALMTYAEILPVGILVSLICALIYKKKPMPQPAFESIK